MSKQTFTVGQVLTTAQMTTLQANDYNQTVSAKVASYVLVAADAGTRITMSNASATTVTVNTALFTAGDTLTITNIGAGVCTITAGTATVSTAGSLALNQYDSGTLYFTSTGVSIWNGANPGDITGVTAGTGISGGGTSGTVTVTNDMATTITTTGDLIKGTGLGTYARLGIGSSSQVLTVVSGAPAWATAASGGGYTLLSTTTMAGTSNATKVSGISQSYKHLFVLLNGLYEATAAGELFIRFNNVTPSNFAFNSQTSVGTTQTNQTISSVNYLSLTVVAPTSAAATKNRLQSAIWVYDYTSTDPLYITAQTVSSDNTTMRSTTTLGVNSTGAAVTEFDLYSDFNQTGTMRIYGVS